MGGTIQSNINNWPKTLEDDEQSIICFLELEVALFDENILQARCVGIGMIDECSSKCFWKGYRMPHMDLHMDVMQPLAVTSHHK